MVYQECAQDFADKPFQIRNLKWVSPLRLAGRENRVEIALEAQKGQIDFWVAAADEPSRVFVRGTVSRTNSGNGTPLDLAGMRERCREKAEIATFYVELACGGLDYGPGFRAVDTLWVGDHECLAHLSLPKSLERDFHNFRLHPALMDGVLQAMACLCKDSTCYLPVAFSQMTVDARLTPTCWVHVREVESGEGRDGSRRFNLSVADESGRALVHVDDLQIVPQTAKKGSCRYLRPVWHSAY